MMAVDTSALVAIALDEPQARACRDALRSEMRLLMSSGTMAEALIVAEQRGFADALSALIEGFGIEVVPVTEASARAASRRPTAAGGRGSRTAGLNFGDCFAYEVEQANACPLLFVGDDFGKTDVRRAI